MTDTIPNVPRELEPCPFCGGKAHAIAENAAKRQPEVVMCLACLGEIEGAGAIDKWNARTLSTPSPAGVGGLEVECAATYVSEFMRAVPSGLVPLLDGDQLCRLPDAQAIIDGLRVDVEVMTQHANNYSRMFEECAEERDQQSQRIGELEGLLRHAQKQVPAGSGLHMRIDSALSAGKEG